MIKTILVPATGAESDALAFPLALMAARLFAAHLEFSHVRTSPGEAMQHMPHAHFAMGEALRNALEDSVRQTRRRSEAAARNVREFCDRHGIVMSDVPLAIDAVSAH